MNTMYKTRFVAVGAMAVVLALGMFERVFAEPATPESVAAAIYGQNAETAADVVIQALQSVVDSDMTDAEKRDLIIAITAKAVVTSGTQAAAMMAKVIKGVPPVWVPVIVASSVVAAGDNSPAVAVAMVEALEGNPELQSAARSAAAAPSSTLKPAEIRNVRTIAVQTQMQLQAAQNAGEPPVFTFVQPAQKYSGQ